MKRVVIISDLHCGHRAGLTPTSWQYNIDNENHDRNKFAIMQKNIWEWYKSKIDLLQPIDALIVNGDAIDGKGEKSGGSEQLESDRNNQAEMASECINYARAGKVYMTYGTPYHTGKGEDFEKNVALKVNNFKGLEGHLFVDVDGVMFDVKHKVGSSSIPHGRHTAISREKLWNMMWHERKLQPKSDILIRSHVHYFEFNGNSRGINFVTPALQGFGSKFGIRECSGIVDIGLIYIDISEGIIDWKPCLLEDSFLAVQPLTL